MNKEQSEGFLKKAVEDFIDICPHCQSKAHLKLLFCENYTMQNGDVIFYCVFRCVPCKKLILETCKFNQNRYNSQQDLEFDGWSDKFPGEEYLSISKFEEYVPHEILEDFKEAVICLNRKCYKASVSMFRRSLQSALLELGANEGEDLVKQIKNNASITEDIKDWAHNIRIFGNWGAHPQNDNLKDVNEKIAKEVKMFLEEFFNYVYVMPSRVFAARGENKKEEQKDEE